MRHLRESTKTGIQIFLFCTFDVVEFELSQFRFDMYVQVFLKIVKNQVHKLISLISS